MAQVKFSSALSPTAAEKTETIAAGAEVDGQVGNGGHAAQPPPIFGIKTISLPGFSSTA